jgi:hypothetical protein
MTAQRACPIGAGVSIFKPIRRSGFFLKGGLTAILECRGGRSAYEFRYALFRYVAKQGKWEAPAIYWRYQTVS